MEENVKVNKNANVEAFVNILLSNVSENLVGVVTIGLIIAIIVVSLLFVVNKLLRDKQGDQVSNMVVAQIQNTNQRLTELETKNGQLEQKLQDSRSQHNKDKNNLEMQCHKIEETNIRLRVIIKTLYDQIISLGKTPNIQVSNEDMNNEC